MQNILCFPNDVQSHQNVLLLLGGFRRAIRGTEVEGWNHDKNIGSVGRLGAQVGGRW